MLAMKDMRKKKDGGKVYGFITTGGTWRMPEYDGATFRKTEMIILVFDAMDRQLDMWMERSSILVECINVALKNAGAVHRDLGV